MGNRKLKKNTVTRTETAPITCSGTFHPLVVALAGENWMIWSKILFRKGYIHNKIQNKLK
jgi:hypothetical protein